MTLVVDASVLVAALVDSGPEGRWAESALADGVLVAPELILAEASNILRRLEHADEISRLEATGAQSSLGSLDLELAPFAPFAERVWSLRSELTGYDAWYVALAEGFECPLVTLDLTFLQASGPQCEIVVPHVDDDMRVRLLHRQAGRASAG